VPASFFREQRRDGKKLYLFSNKDDYKKVAKLVPTKTGEYFVTRVTIALEFMTIMHFTLFARLMNTNK
jgi:hypothetical protein